jgi:hypothetical protein
MQKAQGRDLHPGPVSSEPASGAADDRLDRLALELGRRRCALRAQAKRLPRAWGLHWNKK